MIRSINNPYKVNHKLYRLIFIISVDITILSLLLQLCIANQTVYIVMEILKSIGCSSIASVIVAWIIDIKSTKDNNEKAKQIYDAVYEDLKIQIIGYISSWAMLCHTCINDMDFSEEEYTWFDWFFILRDNYNKEELSHFIIENIRYSFERVASSIDKIQYQDYILQLNNIINDSLRDTIDNLKRAFDLNIILPFDVNAKIDSWDYLESINYDIKSSIEKWVDIKYMNYIMFKPYGFFKDKDKLIAAMNTAYNINDNK